METGIIEVDARHTVRRMRAAMQGNVIKALVELITNSDDSYIRLEDENHFNASSLIDVIYHSKLDGFGLFAVRDHAEGMDIDSVRKNFKRYGAETSGMKSGKRVRGYFGQGAKDALAGMSKGRICTFKNDIFVECRLKINAGQPCYEIDDPVKATHKLREEYGISNNGTIAYFASEKVPRFGTIQEELANNYLLRKILMNSQREVRLIDSESGENRRLRFLWPEGKEIMTDNFNISFSSYGAIPIDFHLFRSEKEELTQTGDNRMGGLLIVDEEDAVLGISLFKFDNEPLASRFFGELKIKRFRTLLDAEEPVLKEERDGLFEKHAFNQMLITEVEKRIDIKVKEEAQLKEKEHEAKIDRDEAMRYSKAFKILNEIAEEEAQMIEVLGRDLTQEVLEPHNGIEIIPSFAQITVGKRYAFKLIIKSKIVPHGSIIQISSSHSKIKILTQEIKISREDGSGIIQKHITIEGLEPNIEGKIKAVFKTFSSESKVQVIAEKELLLSEGMVFQPQSLTLRPNQPRRVFLVVYVKMIESDSRIQISSDNETVHISKDQIIVNDANVERGYAKYEIEIWGEKSGESAVITAAFEHHIALMDTKVLLKDDQSEKNKKGMFNEPYFNFSELNPHQRSSYSAETGQVIIYVNFPSVQLYLGESCQFKRALPAQVLIADLVSECCFLVIASVMRHK